MTEVSGVTSSLMAMHQMKSWQCIRSVRVVQIKFDCIVSIFFQRNSWPNHLNHESCNKLSEMLGADVRSANVLVVCLHYAGFIIKCKLG